MPFNVQEAMAALNGGFAHTSLYDVIITGPFATRMTGTQNAILFRCDSCTLPGRQAATSDFRSYGPVQKIVYEGQYPQVDCTIMMRPGLAEKLFFERWQDIAVGMARGTEQYPPGIFDIGYYRDYIGMVIINHYDANGVLAYKCKLMEAFPVTVGGVQLGWAETDVARLGVSFAYRYFVDDPAFLDETIAAQELIALQQAPQLPNQPEPEVEPLK